MTLQVHVEGDVRTAPIDSGCSALIISKALVQEKKLKTKVGERVAFRFADGRVSDSSEVAEVTEKKSTYAATMPFYVLNITSDMILGKRGCRRRERRGTRRRANHGRREIGRNNVQEVRRYMRGASRTTAQQARAAGEFITATEPMGRQAPNVRHNGRIFRGAKQLPGRLPVAPPFVPACMRTVRRSGRNRRRFHPLAESTSAGSVGGILRPAGLLGEKMSIFVF